MNPDADDLKSIFGNALEITDPSERQAYLDKACGDNAKLREEVNGLLEALDQANDFLPSKSVDALDSSEAYVGTQSFDSGTVDEQSGTVIADKYSLVEPIGEGGMGAVWLAKQYEPVKRSVAIKLIKAGMDSRQVIARFDAERQALALMDHPNIAKVLDGGLHNQRPFFAMELVKGVPITKFCDIRKLTPRERLELFVPVCNAIQHAHQKGIIHRDIKPTNVLVALYDDRPVVKVIDFGLAKATGGILTEQTLDTAFGGVMGTPQYMSPEQATFNNLDIDTRSDVYALGVLLYEMLTGSPPFDKKELEEKGIMEMLRVVREDEPPIPSMRLSTTEALPTLSANRSTEPKKLTGLLRKDLDWVVMKAIEKERSRRYDTANALAADIERYLNDDAVQAHPPSRAYRLGKFIRRHKGQVMSVCAIMLVLVGGIIGTSMGLFEAIRQREFARSETTAKEAALLAESERAEGEKQAKLDAKEKQAQAEKQRAIALAVKKFLQEKLLGQADATNQIDAILAAGGATQNANWNPTIRELLDRAAEELDEELIELNFPNQPLLQAELLLTVGKTYNGIGDPKTAIDLIQRSLAIRKKQLGIRVSATLECMQALAETHMIQGKTDLAIPLFEQTIELRKEVSGDRHTDTVSVMLGLGSALFMKGDYEAALEHYEQLRDISESTQHEDSDNDGPSPQQILDILSGLANAHKEMGNLKLSLEIHEDAVKRLKSSFTETHPLTLSAMSNLASAYNESGKLDLALPLYKKTLELKKQICGPTHHETLTSMNNLGLGYLNSGDSKQALEIFEETLVLKEKVHGREHKQTIPTIHNLALAYSQQNEIEKALELAEEALALAKEHFGPKKTNTMKIMSSLSLMYQAKGETERALSMLQGVVDIQKSTLQANNPDLIGNMNNLGLGYLQTGKIHLAIQMLEDAVKRGRANLQPNHRIFVASLQNLAGSYRTVRRLDKAIPLYEEVLQIHRDHPVPDKKLVLPAMNNLAASYWMAKQLDKSIPLFKETLQMGEAVNGRKSVPTQVTVANLGVNYRDDENLDEAIPLLEEAYQNLKNVPRLEWVGVQLLGAYALADKTEKLNTSLKEQKIKWSQMAAGNRFNVAGLLAQNSLELLKRESYASAKPLIEECLAIRKQLQPEAWTTYNTQSMLGGALLGLKDLEAAEPMLIEGYKGLRKTQTSIPPQGKERITDALERLVKLYHQNDNEAEAASWQKELENARKEFSGKASDE